MKAGINIVKDKRENKLQELEKNPSIVFINIHKLDTVIEMKNLNGTLWFHLY